MIPSSERVEALAHMLPARLSLSRPAMSLTQITMDEVPEGIPRGTAGVCVGCNYVVVATTWWGLRGCGNDVVERGPVPGLVVAGRRAGQECRAWPGAPPEATRTPPLPARRPPCAYAPRPFSQMPGHAVASIAAPVY